MPGPSPGKSVLNFKLSHDRTFRLLNRASEGIHAPAFQISRLPGATGKALPEET